MTKTVTRHAMDNNGYSWEADDGAWVRYEDYARLEHDIEAGSAEIARLRGLQTGAVAKAYAAEADALLKTFYPRGGAAGEHISAHGATVSALHKFLTSIAQLPQPDEPPAPECNHEPVSVCGRHMECAKCHEPMSWIAGDAVPTVWVKDDLEPPAEPQKCGVIVGLYRICTKQPGHDGPHEDERK